jgi:hypothetical protein
LRLCHSLFVDRVFGEVSFMLREAITTGGMNLNVLPFHKTGCRFFSAGVSVDYYRFRFVDAFILTFIIISLLFIFIVFDV